MRLSFLQEFAYKWDRLAYVFADLLYIAVRWYIWSIIYAGKQSLGGFSFEEMMVYQIISIKVLGYLVQGYGIEYRLADDIKFGHISFLLALPFSIPKYYILEELSGRLVSFLTSGLLPVLIVSFVAGVWPQNIVGAAIMIILAMAMAMMMYFTIGLWAVWTKGSIRGLSYFLDSLSDFASGSLLPLSFYPLFVRQFFDLLPFRFFVYEPLRVYFGKAGLESLPILLGWFVLFFVLFLFAWNKAKSKLLIYGG